MSALLPWFAPLALISVLGAVWVGRRKRSGRAGVNALLLAAAGLGAALVLFVVPPFRQLPRSFLFVFLALGPVVGLVIADLMLPRRPPRD